MSQHERGLRGRRAGLLKRERELGTSAEDQQEGARVGFEIDLLTRRIRELEHLGREPQRRDMVLHGLDLYLRTGRVPEHDELDARGRTLHERNAAVDRRMNEVRRALKVPTTRAAYNIGADSGGGVTVPEEWSQELAQVERQFGRVAGLASNVTTTGVGDLHWTTVVDAETAALIAEGGAYVESEDTFGEVVFNAWKYGGLAKASDEVVSDAGVDLANFVAQRAGQVIAVANNPHFVNGTGTGQPRGITNNTTGVTLTAGQTTTITSADSLIDLFHSVSPAYRDNASWLLHDNTVKIVRKLKDTTGQYIWQSGLQAGAPDTILGRAAYPDPDMPVPAAGAKTIYFGDVKRNYLVRYAGPVTVKRLTDLYAANGQVGFRVDRRVDGDIVDTGAARILVQSAT